MRHQTSRRNGVRWAVIAALLVAIAAPLRASQRGPDAAGYVMSDAAVFSFADLSTAGGASVLSGADDATADLTLPFAFQFYGLDYTRVCVSSNGALYFITTPTACSGFTDFANTDLTGTAGPNDLPAIFPFWTDLAFQGGGSVVYQTLGAPGTRRFVIQWNKAYPLGSANPVTFEVVLSEGSNSVLLQYKTVDLGPGDAASKGGHATIGIRNHGSPANHQQLQWSYDVPVIADQTALLVGGDTTAPVIVSATPSAGSLWPPNHQMVPVTITIIATDNDDPAPSCAIASVASNEPVSGLGDGDTAPDWQFAANSRTVNLRAERAGKGTGRIYTITVACSDKSGNSSTKTATVVVPHDQSRK
jgi:hypothetical protein